MDLQSALKLPFNLKIIPVDVNGIPMIPFIAMFNPESLTIEEKIEYAKKDAPGKEGTDPKFLGSQPRSFSIDISLDGTGVNTNGVKVPVTLQVALFRKVTTIIDGDAHRPSYLIVQYGTFICDCCMDSSTVAYTMFDMTGLPIRAKITAKFTERTPQGLGSIVSMLSSPDLTHEVTVKQYDILPLLTHQIYKNQDYYLQVAKTNKLKNFRKLKAGTTLIFRPILKR